MDKRKSNSLGLMQIISVRELALISGIGDKPAMQPTGECVGCMWVCTNECKCG